MAADPGDGPAPGSGVIFDLDGTLADTLSTIADVVNHCLAVAGHPTHDEDAYRRMVGDGIVKLCERVLPAAALPSLPDFLAQVRARYQAHRSDGARLYDGMAELLDGLSRIGCPMGVLSNKPHDLTLGTLEDLGVRDRFGVVVGQSDRFPPKPDPASARHVAEVLGVAPSRVWYLGDTSTDMQTALAAGMIAVGAEWGFRSAQELRDHGARYLARHPRDVLALVRGGP